MTSAHVERRGDHVELVLDRADAKNAMNYELALAFNAATKEAAAAGAKAVLIRAEGEHFGVGGDLNEFDRVGEGLSDFVATLATLSHESVLILDRIDVPIVCAVQGAAAGGGFALALAGDLIIASPEARFRSAYSRIGLSTDLGLSYKLPLRIGHGRATDLIFTDRILDAPTALTWGLVTEVVADRADLLERARELTDQLAGQSDAVSASKRLLRLHRAGSFEVHLNEEHRSMTALAADVWRRFSAPEETETTHG
jgi:2-(1,2-epoxy-1,2-dihydrophenyl)acetyl-CoA isomerase